MTVSGLSGKEQRAMSLSTSTTQKATLEDLERVEGNAELIGGRIVKLSPNGYEHSDIASEIHFLLKSFVRTSGHGKAFADSTAFVVHELRSGRQSFSPDVSFYDGPPPANKKDFISGPPRFAVEIRSKNDHGKAAMRETAPKRADYFEAGTLVVWDVDPDAKCVHVYRSTRPDRPETFAEGQQADAEPALPGWRLNVDEIFR
jgi:Uma2 family endonuclease